MASRTKEQVEEYVEWQCQHKSKVIHSKPEQDFNDLGFEVTVWSVKTDNSDFKNKARLAIETLLIGSDNSELRDHMRKVSNAAWDFANKLTHSTTRTIYEASICVTFCIAVVSAFGNLYVKLKDPIAGMQCSNCGSKLLTICGSDVESLYPDSKLFVMCEKCDFEMDLST